MSRIIPPADYADLALSIKNAADVIHRAAGLSMTAETADAVKAAIIVAKRDAMRLKRELNCAVAQAKRDERAEAKRIAELDAENAARLARYATESGAHQMSAALAEQVAA